MPADAIAGAIPAIVPLPAAPVATDDQLVARALGGQTEAFTELVNRYKRPVYNLAYRMLGNAADAEDAAQETFIRAYTRLMTYQPGGRFNSWLLAITSHWCIDHLRRRRAISLEGLQEGFAFFAGSDYPEELALRAESRIEMQHWLTLLPPSYRAVLVLRYWHELSYNEISQILEQPVSTVRMRLFRARQALGKTREQLRGTPLPVQLPA